MTVAEEFYELPPLEDTDYWERFEAVGLNEPDLANRTNGAGAYTWVDLTSPEYATPPDPPSIEGILYAGRRHVISGPPESTKTLVAYLLLLQALRAEEGVCILDFEMGPHAAVTLLRELGASEDELGAIHYTEPDGPPTRPDIDRIVGLGVGYVVLDAAAGAYDVTGLDDNARKDAEKFAAAWIRPLWQAGIATIVIDHVTKNADTRGKFTIGSERKTGQADVHLSLEALKPLHRGGSGLVRINVHKDRPGHLPRPTVYVVALKSDQEHNITWALQQPLEVADQGGFRHTIYMERVSRVMERMPNHEWSKNELEQSVEGKRDHIRTAIHELVQDGYVHINALGKWPKYTLLRTYENLAPPVSMRDGSPHETTENENGMDKEIAESSPFAPGSPQVRPGELSPKFAPSPQPLQGAKAQGRTEEGEHDQSSPRGEVNVYDPEIQALLDDDGIPF